MRAPVTGGIRQHVRVGVKADGYGEIRKEAFHQRIYFAAEFGIGWIELIGVTSAGVDVFEERLSFEGGVRGSDRGHVHSSSGDLRERDIPNGGAAELFVSDAGALEYPSSQLAEGADADRGQFVPTGHPAIRHQSGGLRSRADPLVSGWPPGQPFRGSAKTSEPAGFHPIWWARRAMPTGRIGCPTKVARRAKLDVSGKTGHQGITRSVALQSGRSSSPGAPECKSPAPPRLPAPAGFR
jgi:hypothetical protein